jgi:hypothetical protein
MIAYEMELITRNHDLRGLVQLLVILPLWRVRELVTLALGWLREGKPPLYWPLFLAGLRGNLTGFGAWLVSRRRAGPYYRAHA